ncbi:trigger factor [Thalassococcus sp. CAU 1522]|uniref:Trigger factor n=1 Tax=Thalassococcus arenae TaxID=2851652 RepID=A0ABS6NB59_9RHOB|nr:DUF6314 family protein [Thalassococcus arenae]MBV2361252.1 trigger factor [Thalassococcus arenae]
MELSDFLGTWTLSRDLDHADGTRARFDGRAVWTAQEDGALYVETGTLTLAMGGAFAAERRYLWDADLGVWFDDGRFFHTVPRGGGTARHWCDPDQYDVAYDFATWPDWTAVWTVKGPRKDYRSTTRYRRTPDPRSG